MSRSDTMARLLRLARLAEQGERTGASTEDLVGHDAGRRAFSKKALIATSSVAALAVAPGALAKATKPGTEPPVEQVGGSSAFAIVGAGLAGLACASELRRHGVHAKVFEASDRVGGRVWSLRDTFPGQVVERGGEFISTSHHAMIGYAQALGLQLERVGTDGSTYFQFGGKAYSEAQVAAEYREFAASIREDLAKLSAPMATEFSEADQLLDFMSIDDYLLLHQAGPLLRSLVSSAYLAEFGADIGELSAISFLRFVHGDKRSKQAPFGTHGDELLRVVGGNDQITSGLAAGLPGQVQLGHRLIAMRKLAGGAYRLTFDVAGRTVSSDHRAVVMTLPFSVLRDVELHSSLQLPIWKQQAIRSASMGEHAKLLVGFNGAYWRAQGRSGSGYSDLSRLPATWEAGVSAQGATLAAHVGGMASRPMKSATTQADGGSFLQQLEQVLPGAQAAALRDGQGLLKVHTENWFANPFSKGSHTCNRPGYFTTTAHKEATAVGQLMFAGEHTSSFHEWQGFMEGAVLSGLRAAGEVLALARPKVEVGAPLPVAPVAPALRQPAPAAGRTPALRQR